MTNPYPNASVVLLVYNIWMRQLRNILAVLCKIGIYRKLLLQRDYRQIIMNNMYLSHITVWNYTNPVIANKTNPYPNASVTLSAYNICVN